MPFAFGACVLDLETRELRRGGAVVHLPPQVYRLLEVLIERRPSVVTRNALDEILWPDPLRRRERWSPRYPIARRSAPCQVD